MLARFLPNSLLTAIVKYKHGFVLNSILKSTLVFLSSTHGRKLCSFIGPTLFLASLYMWEISLYFHFETQISNTVCCFSFTWNESCYFICKYTCLSVNCMYVHTQQVTAASLCCKYNNNNENVSLGFYESKQNYLSHM